MRQTKEVQARRVDNVLYVDAPRSRFVPSFVYYLLEQHNCDRVCFGTSIKHYKKENLKGKESWKEVEL